MAALLGAVFAALAQVFVRKLIHSEKTATIVFYFSLTASILSLVTLPFGWVVPMPREAVLLVERGASRRGGADPADRELPPRRDRGDRAVRVCLDAAWRSSSATRSSARCRRGPMLVGAALIVAAGLFIIWRERRLGIRRAGSRKVMTPQG